jgi:hypothetical protein
MDLFKRLFSRRLPAQQSPPARTGVDKELGAIREYANCATIYQNTIHLLFECGVNPDWAQRIRDEAEIHFPHPMQRGLALNFLDTLEEFSRRVEAEYRTDLADLTRSYEEMGRSEEDIASLPGRVRRSWRGLISILQDDARMDYAAAAVITRTLIPDAKWAEKAVPLLEKAGVPDQMARLFEVEG